MSQLIVENLSIHYSKGVKALDNVSLAVNKGECVGIVGESGSGKSTLAKVLVGLQPYKVGHITFEGSQIVPKKKESLREYRRQVQMVFQDANSTLNPKLPIWRSVLEPLDNFKEVQPLFINREEASRKELAMSLLEMVGLETHLLERFPGELSGGQKQRVSIARALSLEPGLLICDEPTASLDVTVQKQILQLLKELQEKTEMTILFISHDIRAVTFLCNHLIVLKDGLVVDRFRLEDLYLSNRHEYTKALIKAASF
ncbi:ABC transporter ATP-binding protein [Sutcliffiella horikoshii]|uniref:ABC transporter ATP-binding protein n=1 Tax=Sutcliffiella horikoshii TaxID=79883 RepID=UPI001F30D5BB|nr:dipeptide/oligopeptide/nickel ABC transporter ATP-binding protein [Sutcliffiella horikoshii]MCG1022881.1 ABC transporter ATP-binding protein [Sutcliffiella horikoshii]